MTLERTGLPNAALQALAGFPGVALFLVATLAKEYWLTRRMKLSALVGHVWTLLLLLVVAGISAFFGSPPRQIILFAVSVLLSVVLFADVVHFRYFHDLINADELRHLPELTSVGSSVMSFLRRADTLYVFDFPLWVLVCLVGTPSAQALWAGNLLHVGIVLALASAYTTGIGLFLATTFNTAQHKGLANFCRNAVARRGVVSYHLLDACRMVSRVLGQRPASQEEVAKVCRWFKERRTVVPDTRTFGQAKGKNVICVPVESLQGFVIGLTINGHEVTPSLNRLATNSYYFDHFFSQVAKGVSSDASFVVLNSLLPDPNAAVAYRYVGNSFRGLAAVLREHGYSTFGADAQYASFWNMGRTDRAYGFEHGYYKPSFMRDDERNPWRYPDEKFFARCVDLIGNSARPFFSFLRTITSHYPFKQVPPEHVKLDVGSLKGTTLGDYLVSIHYVDAAIGDFLRTLGERGISDESLILFYGDHEGGLDRDEIMRNFGDRFSYLDRNLPGRVPLFIIVPGSREHRVISQPAGQIDIAPTVLHLLGIPQREACFIGSNLFDDRRRPLVVFPTRDFLSDGALFLTSGGSLDGGKLWPNTGGAELDKSPCAETFRDVQERLWISDMVLKHDMIPVVRETLASAPTPPPPGAGKEQVAHFNPVERPR